MNKNRFLPLLALLLASVSAPAFATHPNEVCHVKLDVAALAKTAGGADPSSVRIRFVFRSGSLTDLNPPAPEIVARPSNGSWIYTADIHSNLYYRSLAAVRVESVLYKTTDGTPQWSVATERPAGDDQKADAAIRCENYAD